MPWYIEEKAESGAFATLLGLTLESSDDPANGSWRAIAIGDSCLVHLRERRVLKCFPIDKEELFNNSPVLLSSMPGNEEKTLSHLQTIEGNWKSGDSFYLMTDAFACWFLHQLKDGRIPWQRLQTVGERSRLFGPWIDRLRAGKKIRNDDVTLGRIEIQLPFNY
jgi:hypothetical protein